MTEDELAELARLAAFRFPTYGEVALGALVAAEAEAVEQWAGAPTGVSEAFTSTCERKQIIHTTRPIASIVTVIEAERLTSEPVALTTADYRRIGDYGLVRLEHGWWGELVEVTYHPVINPNLRARVVLDLVALDVDFKTASRVRVGGTDGGVERVDGDYVGRRAALLDQLVEGRVPLG